MSAIQDARFEEALEILERSIDPLENTVMALDRAVGRVLSRDVFSRVDSPPRPISLKDGYAISSAYPAGIRRNGHAGYRLIGRIAAGQETALELSAGNAVKILTGAVMPPGSDTVVPQEWTREEGEWVWVLHEPRPGQDVLARGADVKEGELVASRGQTIKPSLAGLIAASGVDTVSIHRLPQVFVLAVGDELMPGGRPLGSASVYASNTVNLASWLRWFGLEVETELSRDDEEAISKAIVRALERADVVITSGGTGKGEKDLVPSLLERLGWQKRFHGVRMVPGKSSAFGILNERPIFCLPGNPSANEMAFLQLVLPALLLMSGAMGHPLSTRKARVTCRLRPWKGFTTFLRAELMERDGEAWVRPIEQRSRLKTMASSKAIIKVGEDVEEIPEGAWVDSQLMP